MRRTRTAVPLAATALAGALLAGCGSAPSGSGPTATGASPSPTRAADTSLGQGTWLLGVTTATGADAEAARNTYISYDPSTGEASAHTLPSFTAPSADPDDAPLLVSTDRKWAIQDTGTTKAEERSGRLTYYSLATGKPQTLDVRKATGDPSLDALGWAFDPQQPATVRVVDSRNRVWSVDVTGGRAHQTGTVAKGAWVFTNGFNHNSGEPYVESIDSDATKPAGNGAGDHSAVLRAGGEVIGSGTSALAELPTSPCRLGAAFRASGGTTWTFCADGSSLRAYVLAPGSSTWTAYGKPSTAVVPEAASFPLVLPPQQG